MADRLKEIPAKVLEWWNRFTTRQKSVIIGIVATVIFAFAIIVYIVSKPQYTRLITCETTAEAAKVIEILEGSGINHRESTDGLKIDVENSQVSTANLALGAAGYVPDDFGLDDALASSLSTTESDKEKRYALYLQKELESNFEAMPMIKSARIRLHIPEQDGTLIAKKQESSAYIQLELDGTFTSANAANMAKATATFLGNETTANITIIDQDANLLFAGGDDYSSAGIANSLQELQNQAESMMANKVKKVLYGTNQFNAIEVTSHLNMDFASYQETVKEYYANEGRDEGMKSSEITYESENQNDVGGVPGTDSNDGTVMTYQDGSNSSSSESEREVHYLPNESSSFKDLPAGSIDYQSSSMAVAMIRYKEIYEEDVERQGLLDGITWEEYKLANGADVKLEIDPDYYSMAANATDIPQDRITIIAYESPVFHDKEGLSVNTGTVLSVVLFLLILGLLAFVVLRSMSSRKEVAQEEELSVEDLLQSTPEPELEDIDVETKSETRKMIEKFVDDNPEAAAALLRNWLNEDWG
ncbi:MAG: flagellar M-ring protein FliF [Lachnospiraceae bacterium]|nr:flagellar M-ring protein FliF [Lachnospiraceae bacterium]